MAVDDVLPHEHTVPDASVYNQVLTGRLREPARVADLVAAKRLSRDSRDEGVTNAIVKSARLIRETLDLAKDKGW